MDHPTQKGSQTEGLFSWQVSLEAGWRRGEALLAVDERFVALLRPSQTKKPLLRRMTWLSGPRVRLYDSRSGVRIWEREIKELRALEEFAKEPIKQERFDLELTGND